MKILANSDTYQSWFENPYTTPMQDREPGSYGLCSHLRRMESDYRMVANELAAMGIGEEGDEPEIGV